MPPDNLTLQEAPYPTLWRNLLLTSQLLILTVLITKLFDVDYPTARLFRRFPLLLLLLLLPLFKLPPKRPDPLFLLAFELRVLLLELRVFEVPWLFELLFVEFHFDYLSLRRPWAIIRTVINRSILA